MPGSTSSPSCAAAAPTRSARAVALHAVETILSFGTNKLVRAGFGWLRDRGLARYVLPALLINEGVGAYRIYLSGNAIGWW